jgi:hypothetical protein
MFRQKQCSDRNTVQTETMFRKIHVQTDTCSKRNNAQTDACSDRNTVQRETIFRQIQVQTETLFREKQCSDRNTAVLLAMTRLIAQHFVALSAHKTLVSLSKRGIFITALESYQKKLKCCNKKYSFFWTDTVVIINVN